MTKVKYLFSTPRGELQAPENLLRKGLKANIRTTIEHFTLSDYFHSIEDIILQHQDELPTDDRSIMNSREIKELSIVMEKCGTHYQVSRIGMVTNRAKKQDLALITAFDHKSRNILKRDYRFLSHLWQTRHRKVVPRPISISDVEICSSSNTYPVTISIMEWLNGFFEWHFSQVGDDNLFGIVIWQPGTGIVPLKEKDDENKVFENIAEIIAYCFDPFDLRQICLWSNAAGDFVVGWDEKGIFSAKLTTIRKYSCIPAPDPLAQEERLVFSLLYLLLDLTLNIRLDRIDGTKGYFFAEPEILKPVIKGFFKGLRALREEKYIGSDPICGFLSLIGSLNSRDLMDLYQGLMDFYGRWNRSDEAFLQEKLASHCKQLATLLKGLSDPPLLPSKIFPEVFSPPV